MTTQTHDFSATIGQMTLMALRYLNGRRLRSVLTTLSIVFGVALIFAINLVLPSAANTFKQTLTTVTGADITLTSVTGESFAPESVLPQVSAVQDVNAASGILRRSFTRPGSTEQVDLIGIDPDSIQQVRQFVVTEGRFLQAGDSGAAVLPARLAELDPQIQVGKTFPLITTGGIKVYRIVGLLADTGSAYTSEILVNLPDITFAVDSTTISPGLQSALDEVAASLQKYPNSLIDVMGHTDSSGSDAYNLDLSRRRAESVKACLVMRGVAGARIATVGYGEQYPKASNDTPEGRALNRRVEIRITPISQEEAAAARR